MPAVPIPTVLPLPSGRVLLPFSHREQTSLTLAGGIVLFIAWKIGGMAQVPAVYRFDASLLGQPSVVKALFIAIVVTAIGAGVAQLIVGRLVREAAFFGAALGVLAISLRGGPMTCTLQAAASSDVFIRLIVELVLATLIVGGTGWAAMRLPVGPSRTILGAADRDTLRDGLLAAACQAAVVMILLCIFCQSDAKKQVLATVGLATLLGTIATRHFLPTRSALWYCIGPIVVGFVGYTWAALTTPANWSIGRTGIAPAYPLPLDYVGMGVAAAFVAARASEKWRAEAAAAVP